MKIKTIALSFLILVLPFGLVTAAGLVPCKIGECNICHLFQLFTNIVTFVLTVIVPPVATIMFIYGGIIFYTSGGVPEKVKKAKDIITYTVFGLVIIYSAWVVVGTFLNIIGVAEWTGLTEWWEIDCSI
ncbi:MAG: pilin [Patescibacteria group bacterium]|nr:pilin [Patescibacteria group bacterium]